MSAIHVTYGQAAYEALHASRAAREGDVPWRVAWEELDDFPDMNVRRADFEAAAQNVLNGAFPRLRNEIDRLRAERDEARATVREILGHLDDAGITVDDEIRGAWRERAGLENRP